MRQNTIDKVATIIYSIYNRGSIWSYIALYKCYKIDPRTTKKYLGMLKHTYKETSHFWKMRKKISLTKEQKKFLFKYIYTKKKFDEITKNKPDLRKIYLLLESANVRP